jgi:NhaP-type Na+/H+ or K+/H+ antiporter
MVEIYSGLFLSSIIIFIGFVGSILLNRKNIPDAIFLILFGYFLGPMTGIVDPQQLSGVAPYIGALALIAIMFESSLDIDLNELLLSAKPALIISLAGFVVSVIGTFVILYYIVGFMPENPLYSLLIGTIIGGGSGAVIASIAPKISMPNSLQLTLSLESVLTDVYVIVFTLTLMSIMSNEGMNIQPSEIVGSIAARFSTSMVLGFIAGILLSDLIYKFKKEQHIYVMTFAFLILLYVGAEFAGGSGAITVLTAGIVVANLAYLPQFIAGSNMVDVVRYQLFSMESTHSELTLLIRIFFFVEVGLLLDLRNMEIMMHALILSLVLLLLRYPIAYGIAKSMGFRQKTGIAAGISSVFYARGLAAAVMAVVVTQATVERAGVAVPLLPDPVGGYVISIASAVVLFTNIILTVGVVALKNKVKELLI